MKTILQTSCSGRSYKILNFLQNHVTMHDPELQQTRVCRKNKNKTCGMISYSDYSA